MKTIRSLAAVAAASAIATTSHAQVPAYECNDPDTTYAQLPDLPGDPVNPGGAFASDLQPFEAGSFQIADNFTLPGGPTNINTVTFWGVFGSTITFFDACVESPTDVLVIVSRDNAGAPGTTVFTETFTVTPTPVPEAGPLFGTLPTYRFDIDLGQDVDLPASGWIEVIGATPGDDCSFFWMTSSGGDGAAYTFADGIGNPFAGEDFAFCLNRDINEAPIDFDGTTVTIQDTTCGEINDVDNSCMGFYDGGEDIVFPLIITATENVDITLDANTIWAGVAVFSQDPLIDPNACVAQATSSSNPDTIESLILTPGTYYIAVDTFPAPECTDFTLTIERSPIPEYQCDNPLTVYAQPPGLPADGATGFVSDISPYFGQVIKAQDNFTLPRGPAPVNNVTLWGVTSVELFAPCVESPTDIRITFYEDSAAAPGATLFTGTFTVTPLEVPAAGLLNGIYPTYRFDIDLGQSVMLPQTAWIEAAGDTPSDDCFFFWQSSPDGDDASHFFADGVGTPLPNEDFAFCLRSSFPGDTCDNAFQVSSLPYTNTVDTTAYTSIGNPGSCNSSAAPTMDNAVFFALTPTRAGNARIITDGNFDGLATVSTGTCGNLVELQCIDPDPQQIDLPVAAGTTYTIAHGDWGTVDGGGPVQVDIFFPCPEDLNADNAIDVNDLLIVLNNFGGPLLGDANNDGATDVNDLLDILNNFGLSCP